METDKPIKITLKLQGGKNSVIPVGYTETLQIEIIDEWAFFHFQDCKITKRFVETQKADGVYSTYHPLKKKCMCNYPSMNKKQISEHITNRLKELQKR